MRKVTSSPGSQAQPALLVEIEQPFVPRIVAEDRLECAVGEYAVLGFTRSVPHVMDLYQTALGDGAVLPIAQLSQYIDAEVMIAGMVAERRIYTSRGTPMIFLSICDASGVAELTIFYRHMQQATLGIQGRHVICATGYMRQHVEHGTILGVTGVQRVEW